MMDLLRWKRYYLESNKINENKFEIVLIPVHREEKGISIQCKLANSTSDLIKTAIEVSKHNNSYNELKENGFPNMIGYGISFYQKQCIIIQSHLQKESR